MSRHQGICSELHAIPIPMPIHHRPQTPASDPSLLIETTDDGSRTLVRADTRDGYHSSSGALSETRHVYLLNSGVADRLASHQPTRVLEVGLGTGMAMLLTVELAIESATPLHYEALENRWPPAAVLRQLDPHAWTREPDLVDPFLRWRESIPDEAPEGTYEWQVTEQVRVVVHVTDARHWVPKTSDPVPDGDPVPVSDPVSVGDPVAVGDPVPAEPFDAIYFDPFAPHSQPELWQPSMFRRLREQLALNGRLVTYCVSRPVREALQQSGFEVDRVQGPFNGKREVLVAKAG